MKAKRRLAGRIVRKSADMSADSEDVVEGLLSSDLWNRLDFHVTSYVKSPLQLRYVSSKTGPIGKALRHGVVDLLDHLTSKLNTYIDDNAPPLGTECRAFQMRPYSLHVSEDTDEFTVISSGDTKIRIEVSSLAPNVFYQLREDLGISNESFRQSFFENNLKDFTNPGKSGSLMYKTQDDLFILKTLREYEAHLLIQMLPGYCLQFRQRASLQNRYIGLYSLRIQTSLANIVIYVAIMVNAFTPSLRINEIYDLKGSTIKRKLLGYLSTSKFLKLKDMDFKELYPDGILIPNNIYEKLKIIFANDAKVLTKRNITDFSLILGIRHLDMSEPDMFKREKITGFKALLKATNSLVLNPSEVKHPTTNSLEQIEDDITSLSNSYLRPLEILNEKLDLDLYYGDDDVARATLPIPGIINHTDQRVYMYLVIVDMLQTFDSFKHIDQTIRKITDPNRRLEYSVIESNDYGKRFHEALLSYIFKDAKDNFPWPSTAFNKCATDIDNETCESNRDQTQAQTNTVEKSNSDPTLEYQF